MPHVTIEHSANVADHCRIQALVNFVHEAAEANVLVGEHSLRTRAVSREHYRIANGDPRYAFVAITARIGGGRAVHMRDEFQTVLIDSVEAFLATNAPDLITALSVEVLEIDARRENRNQIRTHAEGQSS